MSQEDPDELKQIELITRIALMYFIEEQIQDDIATELGLSRQKIQRLLKLAREKGIVEIHVHTQPHIPRDLENGLVANFGLKEAIVAPSHPDENRRRQSVARSAANYLERILTKGKVVAIGMGRNTGEIPNFFYPKRQIECVFVSAMGGSPFVGDWINPNDICKKMALQSGGTVENLHAPAYVESPRIRDMLINQEVIARTFRIAQQADIAIVGIGMPNDNCTLVSMGCLSLSEALRLREAGATGDLLGDYFDIYGQEIPSDLHGRLLGLSIKDLERIPLVIAVVSEEEKTNAILGALRTGVIDVLITDELNALSLIHLAQKKAQ